MMDTDGHIREKINVIHDFLQARSKGDGICRAQRFASGSNAQNSVKIRSGCMGSGAVQVS
jgi:hypothetical protein